MNQRRSQSATRFAYERSADARELCTSTNTTQSKESRLTIKVGRKGQHLIKRTKNQIKLEGIRRRLHDTRCAIRYQCRKTIKEKNVKNR